MKVAIMQPYFLPYVGYFQLINLSNHFVFLDDVTYQKKGWIDRNKILLEGLEFNFKVPLKNASQNVLINRTLIDQDKFIYWKDKFLRTIYHAYRKAPQFTKANNLLMNLISKDYLSISDLSIQSTINICEYLNIDVCFNSSSNFQLFNYKAENKIIKICQLLNSKTYINMIDGKKLYDHFNFQKNGISLNFINPKIYEYKQFSNNFVESLSIIDLIMFNSQHEIKNNLLKNEF
jgi:hypothetical protein